MFTELAENFEELRDAAGGLEACRDVGSALTGGRARKPSIIARTGSNSSTPESSGIKRVNRPMSIAQSPNIKGFSEPAMNTMAIMDDEDDGTSAVQCHCQ
jgi:hypothetical protein